MKVATKTAEVVPVFPKLPLQHYPKVILAKKYYRAEDGSPEDVQYRNAIGLSKAEAIPALWESKFFDALVRGCILGGRITASAGVEDITTTWINCFVQPVADSVFDDVNGVPGIFEAARQAAQTMRLGGGVGYDFSPIRPNGAWIEKTRSIASGPVSYMEVFNSMCGTVISAGERRGAQMAILRCDHPDIMAFIDAKKVDDPNMPWDKRPLKNFNLSVGVTDELIDAYHSDTTFELVHVAKPGPQVEGAYQRADGKWVYKVVRAVDLIQTIMHATYTRAEPGVVFLDRINKDNNLWYIEQIAATNPLNYAACRRKPVWKTCSNRLGSPVAKQGRQGASMRM